MKNLHSFFLCRSRHYSRRPLPGINFSMVCKPEPQNAHDQYAVVAKAPTNVPEGVRKL